MRSVSLPVLSVTLLAGLLASLPAGTQDAPKETPGKAPAFRLDRRVPFTTSRVVGSPEPPPPYRPVRAFPKLKVTCPMGVAHIPGTDRLLLIHQQSAWSGRGAILRVKDDDAVESAELFLDIDGIAYGVAFHPRFRDNGYLYVGLNSPFKTKPKKTQVVRYTVDRQTLQPLPGSAKVIIEWASDGHNGGDLAFGNDGMLYVSSGDGTSDSDTDLAGQDLTRLLAKVLRIDVDHPAPGPGGLPADSSARAYSVPKDNPFVGQKDIRPETWAYGFRNPWRLHIDPKSGDLWVGNNGQDLWEQIYLVEKGANYGWSVMEGSHPFYLTRKAGPHPFSKPIAEHHHSEARSLSGGVVYHGEKLPGLRGAYLYGDFSTGRIWAIRHEKGKVTWHREVADTPFQITGFGLDSKGELLVADHGGAYYRLEPTPEVKDPPAFPTKLSDTGLFVSVKGHVTQPSLIPYDVNAPLWSDGAHKERYIGIPGEEPVEFRAKRGWNLPEGSVLVKTFSLDLGGPVRRPAGGEAGNPATRHRIETRLLVKQQEEWAGYSYLWNDEQTEATLVAGGGADRRFTIRDPKSPGGERVQTWHYPSRAECMVCHSRAANYVLGLSTVQLNREYDYGEIRMNQLLAFGKLGLFRVNLTEHLAVVKGHYNGLAGDVFRVPGRALEPFAPSLPETPAFARNLGGDLGGLIRPGIDRVGSELGRPVNWIETTLKRRARQGTLLAKGPETFERLVDPSDATQPLEARARSYLHANCAQCHVEAGGGNAMMELEFTTPREGMRVIGHTPQHHTFGVPGAKLIDPGLPEKSMLYLRMIRRGEGAMPPLASAEIDRDAARLIHDWIKEMAGPQP